jgi:metal-sulfur cluster biosynthetic enzyme
MTEYCHVTDPATAVREALTAVRDPELDEDGGALGCGAGSAAEGDGVRVRLRLPTYFCAPNFAYLMVADARTAAEAVPGVARAEVVLEDHFAGEEITAGVAQGSGFGGTFPGLAAGELDDLRRRFRRKAFIARQDRL